jgi:integrase
MTGSTFVRCSCRGADGKQLGAACPALTDRRHGMRVVQVRLDTSTGRVRYKRTVGPARDTTATAAKSVLEHVRDLLKLATDAATAARIGDLLVAAGTGPLPAVADVRRRLGLGGELTGEQTTGELLEEWCAAKSRRWRASTAKGHREKLDQHILPVLRNIPVERLNAAHIDAVFVRIAERNAAIVAGTAPGKPCGPTTQRHVHGVIRAALNWAVKQRRLAFNPASGVELPEPHRRAVVVYDAGQIRAFLAATADDRLAVLWRLILLRGLRRGEALGLRWSGVDTEGEHPRLRIDQTVLQIGGKVTIGRPKTAAGERYVTLDAASARALRAHRTQQVAERLAWGADYEDNDLVFAREDGSPLRPDRISIRFTKLAEKAGLPVIRLHDGRHSAASLGLAAGVDIKVVSDLLGHSTTTITRDLYTHVVPAVHDAAAERMAALIELPAARGETVPGAKS